MISINLIEFELNFKKPALFLTKTVKDGYSKTRIEASSLDELEEREQEFINDLRKEDEFFHTENNEAEIQLLG